MYMQLVVDYSFSLGEGYEFSQRGFQSYCLPDLGSFGLRYRIKDNGFFVAERQFKLDRVILF